MDCSGQAHLPMGFFQARILEWVVTSFSRESFQPRDWMNLCFLCRHGDSLPLSHLGSPATKHTLPLNITMLLNNSGILDTAEAPSHSVFAHATYFRVPFSYLSMAQSLICAPPFTSKNSTILMNDILSTHILCTHSTSPSHLSVCVLTRSVDSLWPHRLYPTRLLWQWNSPGKNTRVSSHSLFQGIFPTHGLNLSLLHCRQTLTVWATREALLSPILPWIIIAKYVSRAKSLTCILI